MTVLIDKNLLLTKQQEEVNLWFANLRELLIAEFELIEREYDPSFNLEFERKPWDHHGKGGGEMGVMRGKVFEKAGVNVSCVSGKFPTDFASQIPGADLDPSYTAMGVSLVVHPRSPKIPIAHFNTRFITTAKTWFGGGGDLTPIFPIEDDTRFFHECFKEACDQFSADYYPKFKAWCDEYFYIKHRGEARGVGGIFYDYLNSGNFEEDFLFTQAVGKAFLKAYPAIVRRHLYESWSDEDDKAQLVKRAKYVEFNLLHDRGTKFGLMTGGNVEAILMSLPPRVGW